MAEKHVCKLVVLGDGGVGKKCFDFTIQIENVCGRGKCLRKFIGCFKLKSTGRRIVEFDPTIEHSYMIDVATNSENAH
jgi:hypothetical protein